DVDFATALLQIGGRFLDLVWSTEALRLHQIITGEASRFPEVARIFYETGIGQTSQAVSRFFQRAAQRGVLSHPDPVFAAQQFLVTLKGFPDCGVALGLCAPPEGAERSAYLRKAIDLFLNGCR